MPENNKGQQLPKGLETRDTAAQPGEQGPPAATAQPHYTWEKQAAQAEG